MVASARSDSVGAQVGTKQLEDLIFAPPSVVVLESRQHFREESLGPLAIKEHLGAAPVRQALEGNAAILPRRLDRDKGGPATALLPHPPAMFIG